MIGLLLILTLLVPQAHDARGATAEPGTAVIRGRVVDKVSGEPLPGAIVRLVVLPDRFVTARTGADGTYVFVGLSSGRYRIVAEPGELSATHLPQLYRERSAEPSSDLVVLRDREIRANVNIALLRAVAISGRVIDELGEPVARMRVEASVVDGAPRAGRETDDRGAFRLFGLSSGAYRVCARPDMRAVSGAGRTSHVLDRPIRTCYATGASAAERVVVFDSDVEGIEIRLRRSRTFTISGTVLDARGLPAARATGWLASVDETDSSFDPISVDAAGRFKIAAVAPGAYSVGASVVEGEPGVSARPLEAGSAPVVVAGDDVNGVVVAMAKTVTVVGRFVLTDSSAPPPELARSLGLEARIERSVPGQPARPTQHASIDRDLTFRLEHLYGRRVLVIPEPIQDFVLKAIMYKGRDVLDRAVEFAPTSDPNDLQIVLTTRAAVVSGSVSGESGSPVRARILMVPTDPARWASLDRAESAMSAASGQFRLNAQRPGDYAIVAVDEGDTVPVLQDAAFFARVVKAGQTITLTENDRRTVDLRVTRLPEEPSR